jgi:predicted negative regulator of RcsB-dependent stress response
LNSLLRELDGDRLYQPKEDWDALLAKLSGGGALAKGDPFLESVYWDKVAAFEYGKVDYNAHLAALQNAVSEGYPTAALCFELGNLYMTKGHRSEAIAAYQQATQAPLDLTPSKLILSQLKSASPAK